VDGNYMMGAPLDFPPPRYQKAYVRHGNLQSVGELGFIPLAPFFSITLYDPQNTPRLPVGGVEREWLPKLDETREWSTRADKRPYFHRVLDYFTLEDENKPVRGKVNLANNYIIPTVVNGKTIEVAPALASVFADLPTDLDISSNQKIPVGLPSGRDTNNRIILKNSSDVAARLAEIQKHLQGNGDSMKYLSDLAALFDGAPHGPSWTRLSGSVPPGGATIASLMNSIRTGGNQYGEWEREALIANAANLFTLRDQTYTILLRADAFTSGHGMEDIQKGSTLGTAHAVVEIWRDPVPDASGRHNIQIQNFRILE